MGVDEGNQKEVRRRLENGAKGDPTETEAQNAERRTPNVELPTAEKGPGRKGTTSRMMRLSKPTQAASLP